MKARRSLRVLLLSPSLRGGGNATSVRRLAAGLRVEGVGVRLLAAAAAEFPARLAAAVEKFRPDLVHAFHARKGGAVYLAHAVEGDPPLVISLTGTEIHRDLGDPALARRALDALGEARVVLSQGKSLAAAALAAAPGLAGRMRVVPKGVALPPRRKGFDLRARAGLPARSLVFLLPAGLREVKDPLFALDPLERLHRTDPRVAFVHAGESLDPGTVDAMRVGTRGTEWARTTGPLPFASMGSAYAQAAVVLNTSRAEGLANALAEAAWAGRAVLASDIPANREVVTHGRTGLLYRSGDEASFLRAARRLARDPSLRRRLGAAARVEARRRFSPRAEARAVLEAYDAIAS